MTRDVTKSGGGLTEAPKLSHELRKILQRRKVVPDYGGDDGVSAGGGNFRDGVWDPPEWVDARERDEAKQKLSGFEGFLRPVTAERIREFLLFLWNSTKHQNDTSWEAVAAVYPMMLDGHPSWCFRPERLKLAAQHAFDWFPTVRQLVEFMEPDRQEILQTVAGLKTVSETTTAAPKSHRPGLRPWAEGGAEDHAKYLREKQDRERRELVEIMRKRDEEAGRVPMGADGFDRLPGESDETWMARMKALRDVNIDLGAKARRADEARYRRAKGIEAEERVMRAQRPTPPPTPDAMRAAYAATGIKPQDLREAQTAGETARNTMSGGEG
jgi:hypothetical protein